MTPEDPVAQGLVSSGRVIDQPPRSSRRPPKKPQRRERPDARAQLTRARRDMSLASPLPTSRGALSSHRAARLSRLRPAPKPTRRRRRAPPSSSPPTRAGPSVSLATSPRRVHRRDAPATRRQAIARPRHVPRRLRQHAARRRVAVVERGARRVGLAGCDLANRVSTRSGWRSYAWNPWRRCSARESACRAL